METFFKKLWIALTTPIEIEEESEPLDYYRASKEKEKADHWCPYCGYNGTADNLRCHLLNDHKQ